MIKLRNIFKKFTLILIGFGFLSLANAQVGESITASRVTFADPVKGRQLAISFHHAILETNFDDGYVIANLSPQEKSELANLGFKISFDKEWQSRYDLFQQKIAQEIKRHSSQKLAGIPGFACYARVEESFEQASAYASSYPDLAEWIDIGDSWKKTNGQGGHELMVLKITNKNITGDKPKLFLNSGLHAREYAPVALTMDFANKLLTEYETNADIRWIVDHHEVHLLLQTNPDGRKIAEAGVYQRKNMNSNHCPGSGVGVDLNRNFAHSWNVTANGSSGYSCSQVFRGDAPESEPETQALSQYVRSIFADRRGPGEQDAAPNDATGMHIDIHSYSELVLWPYGHTMGASPNNAGFVALGNKLAWFNNYTPQQSIGLYATDGTSDNVSYGELGVAAMAFELGTSFFQACETYESEIKGPNLNALLYAAKVIAAPYLLAYGPEVIGIDLNGASNGISVVPGTSVKITAAASAMQSKLATSGRNSDRSISRIEYTLDVPFWQEGANVIELTENDGDLSSGIELMSGDISTTGLALGEHTIFFRAYNEAGQVGVTSASVINIVGDANSAPVAEFTHQCTYSQCEFDATASSDSDGSIASYLWEFEGGETYSTATVSHSFDQIGEHSVSLTVTDNEGTSASKSLNVTTTSENSLPVAEFSYQCSFLTCDFDASSSTDADGTIVGYEWQFSGSEIATGQTVTHQFSEAGFKQVDLMVSDNNGDTTTKSVNFSVSASPEAETPQSSSSGGGLLFWINGLLVLMLSGRKYLVQK